MAVAVEVFANAGRIRPEAVPTKDPDEEYGRVYLDGKLSKGGPRLQPEVLLSLKPIKDYHPRYPFDRKDYETYGWITPHDFDEIMAADRDSFPIIARGLVTWRRNVLVEMVEGQEPRLPEVRTMAEESCREAVMRMVQASTNLEAYEAKVYSTILIRLDENKVQITTVKVNCEPPSFATAHVYWPFDLVGIRNAANGLGLPEDHREIIRAYQRNTTDQQFGGTFPTTMSS